MSGRRFVLPSRFATLPRWTVALAAGLALLLIAIGLQHGVAYSTAWDRDPTASGKPHGTDIGDQELYRIIIDRVAAGGSYYAVTADALRTNGYPLQPVFTIRLPTLAVGLAALPGEPARRGALIALIGLTLAAWAWRAHKLLDAPGPVGLVVALVFSGLMAGIVGRGYVFHETWAAVLIALSLAIRSPARWWPSVLVGLIAVLVRELVLGYLIAMAVAALLEKQRREAAGWACAILIFFAAMALHAHFAALELRPGDLVSHGWMTLGGWPFVLLVSKWCAVLTLAPVWLTAILVPLMLLGLIGWPGALGLRLMMIVFGYTATLMVVGRPDNSYWGLIIAPLLPLGFLHLPDAAVLLTWRQPRPDTATGIVEIGGETVTPGR